MLHRCIQDLVSRDNLLIIESAIGGPLEAGLSIAGLYDYTNTLMMFSLDNRPCSIYPEGSSNKYGKQPRWFSCYKQLHHTVCSGLSGVIRLLSKGMRY